MDRFLPGRCISMDIAADGSAWVLAAEETLWDLERDYDGETQWVLTAGEEGRHLYVITPEAVTATESR